jgi:Ser/Thr protein kinase RdoA (MazF antagonist)
MRDILADQIDAVQMMKDTRVWSHGDFHSENMMLGPGITYAFDLTEARMKLAIYDIVTF